MAFVSCLNSVLYAIYKKEKIDKIKPLGIISRHCETRISLPRFGLLKKIIIIIVAISVPAVLVAAYLVSDFYRYIYMPGSGRDVEKVVLVEPGTGLVATTEKLRLSGLIQSPLKFRVFARFKGYDKKIKAGEYLFSTNMSPEQILDMLVNGKVLQRKLTVPEGYNLEQIAGAVENAELGEKKRFLGKAKNAAFAKENGIAADTLEGYLFPDTYFFPRKTTPEKIIAAMLGKFRSVFTPEWKARAKTLGLSVHEVVTLASIVEKETGAASERPLIASVFHNRLKRGMRLDSDPTVIYGIKNFNGNLTKKNLQTRTPYNTYMIRGLPPGPIANPGKKSIEAVLFPAGTRFLYFVSKKDGTHKFSANLSDHNKAVRKYQLSK